MRIPSIESEVQEMVDTNHWCVSRYLPGIRLPENVVAVPNLIEAANDATLLIFVLPHQFVSRVCEQLKGASLGAGARAISLIKGLDTYSTTSGIELVSQRIRRELGLDVSVLMGANLAMDIARERFSEATIGFGWHSNAAVWRELFEQPAYFRISLVDDATGVELCGALKNIIAVAAGIVDGLFPEGGADNTKAAVIRRGLLEMRALARVLDANVKDETFVESCGLADVITSSYGGRNRRVAEAMVRTGRSISELEVELLGGQKLQGPDTAAVVHTWLAERGLMTNFPIMTAVYRICFEGRDPRLFLSDI